MSTWQTLSPGVRAPPLPATAMPSQPGCGQGTRSAHALAAALRLRCRYCSSSATVSSSGMSGSRKQHQALGPLGIPSPCPASCSRQLHAHWGVHMCWSAGAILMLCSRDSFSHTGSYDDVWCTAAARAVQKMDSLPASSRHECGTVLVSKARSQGVLPVSVYEMHRSECCLHNWYKVCCP